MDRIYKISHSEIFNRYMTANRLIKQGELILKESPVIVDSQVEEPICFNCCKFMGSKDAQTCERCNIALLCGKTCNGNFHSIKECETLFKSNLNPTILKQNSTIITPLRLFLLKNYNDEAWKKINALESHLDSRRNTSIWNTHKVLVENVLEKENLISEEDVTNETIQRICGVLDVNTFEIRPPLDPTGFIQGAESNILRGLYLEAALMAHDCVSNTHLAVDDDFVLYIHASVDIQEGSPIFFNYSNILLGNNERKKILMEGKYFECTCKRCLDPTELGTELSSLNCHTCRKGIIQLRNFNSKIVWTCTICSKSFNSSLIETILGQLKNMVEDADKHDLAEMEKLHTKLLQVLHPQHYLILNLEQNLIGLYTNCAATKKNLHRKIELCQNLIRVSQILEPGISRTQGMVLYELHSAIANLAYLGYSMKEINMETLLQRLLTSEATLKTALKHLLYEPKKSLEGYLAQNALGYLKILRDSINGIKKELKPNITDKAAKSKKNKSKK